MTQDRTRSSARKTARTSAQKSAEKETAGTAKKTSAKKSPAKKAPTRKTSSGSSATRSTRKASAPRAEAPRRPSVAKLAAGAAEQLLELAGKEVEGVTSIERTDDGWRFQVEVLEVRRIPDTTDVLSLYEVSTDDQGDLEGYRRLRRYTRGAPGEERP